MDKQNRTYLIQLLLFVATLISTTLAGAEWMFGRSFIYGPNTMGWDEFFPGLIFLFHFYLF